MNPAQCPELNPTTGYNTVASTGGTNFVTATAQLISAGAFNYAMNSAAAIANASQNQATAGGLSQATVDSAKNNGWIFAGAFYYAFAGQNNATADFLSNFVSPATIQIANLSQPPANASPIIQNYFKDTVTPRPELAQEVNDSVSVYRSHKFLLWPS